MFMLVLMLIFWATGQHFVEIAAPSLAPERIAEGEKWVNLIWAGVTLSVAIGLTGTVLQDLRRIRKPA